MHQAQVLRSRIEIRVHRIPMAMRKVNMGELLLKHSQGASTAIAGPSRVEKPRSPAKNLIQEEQSRASPSPQRGQKRLRYVPFPICSALLIQEVMIYPSTKRTKTSRIRRNELVVLLSPHEPPPATSSSLHKSCHHALQTLALCHDHQSERLSRQQDLN